MDDETPRYPSDPSERARQLVAEGKIGGARPGAGRPRKVRASQLVAEAAAVYAADLVDALASAIEEGQPPAERSRAADRWLRIVLQEGALQARERSEDRQDDVYARLSDEDIRKSYAKVLAEGIRSGDLDLSELVGELDAGPVIDADVVEPDAA